MDDSISWSSLGPGSIHPMASKLGLCPHCDRHVSIDESACPFCDGALAFAPGGPVRPVPATRTRAALLFAGAAVVAGCGSTEVVAMYGPAPVDASVKDTAADGPTDANNFQDMVAMYGPAPIDSGNDALVDGGAKDSGGG